MEGKTQLPVTCPLIMMTKVSAFLLVEKCTIEPIAERRQIIQMSLHLTVGLCVTAVFCLMF